jgi:hypothetical protein
MEQLPSAHEWLRNDAQNATHLTRNTREHRKTNSNITTSGAQALQGACFTRLYPISNTAVPGLLNLQFMRQSAKNYTSRGRSDLSQSQIGNHRHARELTLACNDELGLT